MVIEKIFWLKKTRKIPVGKWKLERHDNVDEMFFDFNCLLSSPLPKRAKPYMVHRGNFRNKMRDLKVFKMMQEYTERNGNKYLTHIYLLREMEETKLL